MWKKSLSPLSWAGLALVCLLFASATRAAAAPADRRSSSAPANADSAAAGAAQARYARRGAQPRAVSNAPKSAAVVPRRGFVAPRAPNVVRRGPNVGPRAPNRTAAASKSPISGPRVQSMGRLRGAEVGRSNHGSAIDGTQFRRKF